AAAWAGAGAAAGDASRAAAARKAADKANAAAAGARKAADAADQAGIAAEQAATAAGAAASAGANAAAAAAAAADAGRWAGEAGAKGEEAAAAAAKAKRLADQASRAAASAQSNARQAATAARQSRDAANETAAHAEAAAIAANKAADAAGQAVDAAKASTDAANAATEAANRAMTAAEQASTVVELARKADTERLAQQQDEAVLAAEEAAAAHDEKVAASQWEIGKAQELGAQTQQLVTEAAASTDLSVTAAKGRQAAVNLLSSGGTWVKDAAEDALAGSDDDVADFVRVRLAVAMEQDDRASVGHIATTSTIPAQRQAALDVLDKPIGEVRAWLRTRAYPGKEDDDRVAVGKIAAEGGPGVKAAASRALDGTAADLAAFLETGQYAAQEDDDRVAVSEALAEGGPEVRAAAQAVLSGPASGLRPFLEIGLHQARQRDANAAAHLAEVNILLQAAYKSAALAQKDAADAQKVAAQARKDAAKATEWANAANDAAKRANTYAEQADKSADQAEASAAQAAESARKARNAAASAQADARSAARSAERAQHSAAIAYGYSMEANNSAYQAGLSQLAAEADSAAAAKAAGEAMKTAADLLVAELKKQIQEEAKLETSKPLSDNELRAALERRLVDYRSIVLENGDLKPGETMLVCGGDGAGGMGCITSTTLDRLIAWYIGADEIEDCLQNKKPSCLSGLALSALKLKFLKKLHCGKASFVPGTRVLMAGGRTEEIEDIRIGDQVVSTDPETGRTEAKRVRATINSTGRKNLVEVPVTGPDGRSTGSVVATENHPFWAGGDRGTWVDAGDLTSRAVLRTDSGDAATVGVTRAWAVEEQRVQNLTVADFNTYYVLAGATPVLVHNASCPIGFTEDTVGDAFNGMNKEGGHAMRHLKEDGLIPNKGSVASQRKFFEENFSHVLTSPDKTFDWKIGSTPAKGFAKKVDGKVVVIFVAKEGQYQGKILSAMVPPAKNLLKWGLL
ncbi:polymorphic toxin-type HINT domain-containing protein, partial [Streptomyces griseorubiginosus]|uniref:polymorphic toxin-type HINT domain-containing protein n=1 Tax=Streptomyces griseorubiginosus TaxID=67304 RepID=UPI003666850E